MATAKKKPSAAQLAARKRFAEMARAGAFKKHKKAAKPKARKAPKKVARKAAKKTATRRPNPARKVARKAPAKRTIRVLRAKRATNPLKYLVKAGPDADHQKSVAALDSKAAAFAYARELNAKTGLHVSVHS